MYIYTYMYICMYVYTCLPHVHMWVLIIIVNMSNCNTTHSTWGTLLLQCIDIIVERDNLSLSLSTWAQKGPGLIIIIIIVERDNLSLSLSLYLVLHYCCKMRLDILRVLLISALVLVKLMLLIRLHAPRGFLNGDLDLLYYSMPYYVY